MEEFQADVSGPGSEVFSSPLQGLSCENKADVPWSLGGAAHSEKAKLGCCKTLTNLRGGWGWESPAGRWS